MDFIFGRGGLKDGLVDGAASVGRATSYMGALSWTVASLLGLALSAWLLLRPRKRTANARATVVGAPSCAGTTTCTVPMTFTPAGAAAPVRSDIGVVSVTNTTNGVTTTAPWASYAVGQSVELWYDPAYPESTANLNKDDFRAAGGFIGTLSLVVLIGAWLRVFLVTNIRGYAAVEGARNVVGLFRGR